MDNEIGKWYKAPGGSIYRINYAIKHPVDDEFFIQIEKVPCIWDYTKRSASSRYEIKEYFFMFYLDPKDDTEQQIINKAYITGMLLNESLTKLNKLITGENVEDINKNILKKNKVIQDFQFKSEEIVYREATLEGLRDTLDIDIMDALQIVSPY